jgi:formate dehydrogenase subunit gamma
MERKTGKSDRPNIDLTWTEAGAEEKGMNRTQVLPNGQILRYSFGERVMHWLAGFSYLYLLLSGLAFWSPWLFWMATILGGGTVAREIHPWVGLVFTVAVLWMYAVWHSQMRFTEKDRAWWRALPHYIRNEDEAVPPQERFNAGQKLLFWGFFWCGIALFLSGLVLWFPASIPWNFRAMRYAAVIIHPAAALLTIGLFMVHVYMGTAMERGSFESVIRGSVSLAWARKFHPLWYEQIMGKK